MKLRLIGAGMAALSVLAVSGAAQGADGPKPVYKARPAAVPVATLPAYTNWSGAYAGFLLGYGWGTSNWGFPVGTSLSPSGLMFGGTFGYNMQMNQFVMGFEADLSWSGVKGSAACGAYVCETSNRWLSTFRGRLGLPMEKALPYLTGGLAYGDFKATTTNPALTGGSRSGFGWTVGGGIEFAMASNMTAKLEYLYVDLGSFDCGANCAAGTAVNSINFRENILRFGLNYKLNAGAISARY